ncbi:HAD family hydrolase [Thermocoleostomius sinensis]|uniref:Beta-phosphoglucomutase n=1 Tax=Thermocoleostomius sinensis A174 TaxID=2016057 RepID=A0A9E8Z9B1_9CYAN|nr:HAD family phosphatase [Thermocoleostomius sinensis]WAL58900.1 HAD family phosphatase [Thermocoleostomius sinensis A174]
MTQFDHAQPITGQSIHTASIAFIFDMDGTMIDNMAFHQQAWQQFLTSLGIEMTNEELDRHNHGTITEVLRRICGNHLTDAEVVELGNHKERIYRELYRPHLKLIAGLPAFLEQAKQLGIPMALATSAGKANIDLLLDGLKLRSYFDTAVGGDDVTFGKPHPETFLKAAQQLQRAPTQCLVFEDTLSGVEAAQNAGMKAIAVTTTLPPGAFQAYSSVQQTIEDFTTLQPSSLLKQFTMN